MARNYVKQKKLSHDTPIEELEDRYYTPRELATLLNCHYDTVLSYIHSGRIKSNKNFSGFHRIPRTEVIRVLGGDVEDTRYLRYDGICVPHMNYLMYVMIESSNNPEIVNQRLEAFRLPRIPRPNMDQLWDAILATAPRLVKSAILKRRPVNRAEGFRSWVESLGIAPLFDNLTYPCRNLLLDHSKARISVEALLGGRVALEEISDFIERKWGKLYNVEQLKFFQYYFYNVLDFTNQDYLRYLKLLKEGEEVTLKRNAWDDPNAAKLQAGIPTRVDMDLGLNRLAETAIMQLNNFICSGYQDPSKLKVIADTILKTQNGLLKQQKAEEEGIAEAMQRATDSDKDISIEKVEEEPLTYEDLGQDLSPVKAGEVEVSRAG